MTAVAKIEDHVPDIVVPATSLMEIISRAASDPNTDVDKLERLMAMAERIEARNAEQAFSVAMAEVQTKMRAIAADASNPQTKSKYASYPALDRAVRPIYTDHGFALSFDTGDAPENVVRVLCYVSHKGGHSRTYRADMPADGKGAKGGDVMTRTHAAGAAMSYGQRYLLKLIFNIAVGDDDDGNSAGGNGPISDEQFETICGLIEKFNADIPKFCKYMGVAQTRDIPASQYRKAIESLNLKGKQK